MTIFNAIMADSKAIQIYDLIEEFVRTTIVGSATEKCSWLIYGFISINNLLEPLALINYACKNI